MINYGRQWLDEDDIDAVTAVLRSDFLTQGPWVGEFEGALANYVGAQYAVAVSSGTAALHLAVQALNIEKGCEGMTAPNTFAASANCFLYNRLTPSFADIDAKTYSMDPAELEKKLSPNTRVVIPVHFAGQPADMETIASITKNKDIHLIEDASHAVGSKYANRRMVGSCCYSDMTVFSFHPVKTIATAEGGAITTNNKEFYQTLLLLRNHGITKDESRFVNPSEAPYGPWYYEMQALGFNYRLTDMQAALGFSQLKKIGQFVARRREIVRRYNLAFKEISFLTIPYEREEVFSAFHLYVLKIDFEAIKKTRTRVMHELREKGVGTQVHYIPVHLQPYYKEHFHLKEGDFPAAEDYYRHCLSIPLFPKMTDSDIDHVIESIIELKE
jgi:perosamine synthetase